MKLQRVVLTAVGVVLFLFTTAWANIVERQPGPTQNGMDVWYGNVYYKTAIRDEKLQAGGWGDQYHTLIRFDLSGLPQVADLAILWLYAFPKGDASTPTPTNWYLITSQWHTGTVGWNTQPASTWLGWRAAPPSSGWYGINFTNQYNQWRSGNASSLNYGLRMAPMYNNNRFDLFHSSRSPTYWARPALDVYYTPRADDQKIKLLWPLAIAYASRVVTHPFGADWAGGSQCPAGVIKKHNGTDFAATAGTAVYAAEDGWVKHVENHSPWAYHIVIEHISPTGAKYTTTSWHVNALVAKDNFVPKGMQIATVADLGSNTHLHFGIRRGVYDAIVSGVGGLPQVICTDPNGTTYPGFPENFIDPEDSNFVLFQ